MSLLLFGAISLRPQRGGNSLRHPVNHMCTHCYKKNVLRVVCAPIVILLLCTQHCVCLIFDQSCASICMLLFRSFVG